MFRNSPQPTKAESEKAFGLEFVAMMGNVKAFILSICLAVVFCHSTGFRKYNGDVYPGNAPARWRF